CGTPPRTAVGAVDRCAWSVRPSGPLVAVVAPRTALVPEDEVERGVLALVLGGNLGDVAGDVRVTGHLDLRARGDVRGLLAGARADQALDGGLVPGVVGVRGRFGGLLGRALAVGRGATGGCGLTRRLRGSRALLRGGRLLRRRCALLAGLGRAALVLALGRLLVVEQETGRHPREDGEDAGRHHDDARHDADHQARLLLGRLAAGAARVHAVLLA